MSACLELAALSCRRGRRVLFKGLNQRLEGGQLLRVEGENGAGKTSLLRLLCGLARPEAGEIRWCGEPVAALDDEFQAQLLYLGHAWALKDDFTALENLRFSLRLCGEAADQGELVAALTAAGLASRMDVPVRLLSQGQRRRAALARLAVSAQRPLWILDEPFNALDAAATAWLSGLIERHLAACGLVVLTSHQPLPFAGVAEQRLRL